MSTAESSELNVECSVPCNLCGSRSVNQIGDRDRDGSYLRSVICKECGLSWSDPRPNEQEIKDFYTKNYRIEYKGTYIPQLKHVYRAGLGAIDRFEFFREVLKEGDVLLDVGSGGGEFVYLLNKLGFEAYGIEPNEGYGTYARDELGLPVEIGFVQQKELEDESFDLITMHHVLEHLDDPFSILARLNRSLKKGGYLVVEVPNIESTVSAPWNRFHAAHLYNFNPDNLETMGRKAGFSVFRTRVSSDGGVITTIFKKSTADEAADDKISGNFQRVMRVLRDHTNSAHYRSPNPYLRPIRKIGRYFSEKRGVNRCRSGKDVLDKMFSEIS